MLFDRVFGGDFPRAETAVKLDHTVGLRLCGVFLNGIEDHGIVVEQFRKRRVAAEAERAEQNRRGQFPRAVDVHPKDVLRILLKFQPGAAGRHHRRVVNFAAGLVHLAPVVNAGASDQLRDDHAFRAVDDERAVVRHQRKIPHEYFLIDDFVRHLVDEANLDSQREGERRVSFAAFLFAVFRRPFQRVIQEVQFKVVGIIRDRRKVLEHLADPLADKTVVGVLLDFDKIGNFNRFLDLAESLSLDLSTLNLR